MQVSYVNHCNFYYIHFGVLELIRKLNYNINQLICLTFESRFLYPEARSSVTTVIFPSAVALK